MLRFLIGVVLLFAALGSAHVGVRAVRRAFFARWHGAIGVLVDVLGMLTLVVVVTQLLGLLAVYSLIPALVTYMLAGYVLTRVAARFGAIDVPVVDARPDVLGRPGQLLSGRHEPPTQFVDRQPRHECHRDCVGGVRIAGTDGADQIAREPVDVRFLHGIGQRNRIATGSVQCREADQTLSDSRLGRGAHPVEEVGASQKLKREMKNERVVHRAVDRQRTADRLDQFAVGEAVGSPQVGRAMIYGRTASGPHIVSKPIPLSQVSTSFPFSTRKACTQSHCCPLNVHDPIATTWSSSAISL